MQVKILCMYIDTPLPERSIHPTLPVPCLLPKCSIALKCSHDTLKCYEDNNVEGIILNTTVFISRWAMMNI